ncbi:MAG: CPBP family intramembrane metalloprotease [Acidobacteria bacterium]|nr:CPBP family intramembrane metalloprotease [Acidobacteriota bacterium]
MSSNAPWSEPSSEAGTRSIAPPQVEIHPPAENPPWSGGDVVRIALLMFVIPYCLLPLVAIVVQKLFYGSLPWILVAQKPWVALSTQFAWYAVVAAYMISFVEGTWHQSFWTMIRWNWPTNYWPAMVPIGILLVFLQSLERFFNIPKHIPMEEFLSTPIAAALTGIFAVTFGPLMEELFFRGFLYPVIARRFGMVIGVLTTATAFGLIHAAQLAFAWGLVLIIFLVGLVLTIVRARTGSVGASFVVHVAYNSTLVVLGLIASQHLAK